MIHDTAQEITLVVDQRLRGADQLNFHPMTHTESIGLSWDDFVRFARSCGHEPVILEVAT